MHDNPTPTYHRRSMAFVDAIFDGQSVLEGTRAKRASLAALPHMLECGKAVPIVVDDLREVLDFVRPFALVDARMDKRAAPECQLGWAPVTIGVGPNFVAGVTTALIVESAWGESLGTVHATGSALPLGGEPREMGGYGRERMVYAPQAGRFETHRLIGEWIDAGEVFGTLQGKALEAPLAGRIRGLTRSDVTVPEGTKVFEVDPRGKDAATIGIGERPRRIAEGVLRALSTAVR